MFFRHDADSSLCGALFMSDGGGKGLCKLLHCLTVGMLLWWSCHHHKQELRSRDGFLIVVAFWFVLGGLATLPLLLFDSPSFNSGFRRV